MDKFRLWTDMNKGLKSRLSSELKSPVASRADVSTQAVNNAIDRGSRVQKLRLKHYPSIDVNADKLYAGEMEGSLSDAEDKLTKMGFRNDPTAYVEVTNKYGPDEGSYSRQMVSETGARFNRPTLIGTPSVLRRVKDQVHVTIQKVDSKVIFLAHREQSAWLEPARHVLVNDASARRGTLDFRDIWYFTFDESLSGEEKVSWPTAY